MTGRTERLRAVLIAGRGALLATTAAGALALGPEVGAALGTL